MKDITAAKKFGFGAMRLPTLTEGDPKSIDHLQLCQMVDYYLDQGFFYFDTAYPYHQGCSEVALKKALVQRHPRESFLLADKMPCFSVKGPQDYPRFFQEQLDRTGAEYFDYYLLHNLGKEKYAETEKFGGFAFMEQLKAQGKVRHIGFSFHDTADVLEEILKNHPEMEFVQLQINYIDWESPSIQSRKCYEVARKYGKPIWVMEPIKGGGLANLPEAAAQIFHSLDAETSCASYAIGFAASLEGVARVLSGMSTLEQLKDNTAYMSRFRPLTQGEREAIAKVTQVLNSSRSIPCTACQYCVDGCPKNINIPGYFSVYNLYTQYGSNNFPQMHYNRASHQRGLASQCIGCKQCERHCPQHIHIIEELKKVAELFERE